MSACTVKTSARSYVLLLRIAAEITALKLARSLHAAGYACRVASTAPWSTHVTKAAFVTGLIFAVTAGCSLLFDEAGLGDGAVDRADDASLDGAAEVSDRDAGDGAACNADLAKDPRHCGRCGRDCLGGTCAAGRCAPVQLTGSEVNIDQLRIAQSQVLFRANSQIRSLDIQGGLPVSVACSSTGGLAIGSRGFYAWCNCDVTLHAFADGGALGTFQNCGARGGITSGGFFAYTDNDFLERIPEELGDAGLPRVAFEPGGFRDVTATGSLLFYMTNAGKLAYAQIGAGGPTELERNQSAPGQIAADPTGVFWLVGTDTPSASLRFRPLSGGATTTLVTGLDHANDVALDATHVYLTLKGTPPAHTNGSIVRAPRGGGSAEILVENVLQPDELLVTDRYVVYTSRGTVADGGGYVGGAVFRLAK